MEKSIKDLEVHKGDSKDKKTEASPLYKILEALPKPDAKMKLTSAQKYWWYYFGVHFCSTKQFSEVDLMHLQNAAINMDARCKLIKKINELNKEDEDGVAGWVQKFKSGASNVTGYQTMYEKATKQLDDVSSRFGLSFSDRAKLKAEKPDTGQLDMFNDFLKLKTS